MVDTSKKPYVRYTIKSAIEDRGIGFAIKKALQTFMSSHGYEAKVTDFRATSDFFSAEIEIYDNGKLDFNARALYEHIVNSGRMPTNTKKKPELEFLPLPCDYCVADQPRDDEGFVKTIEQLGEEIKNREKEIKDRDKNLKSRDVTISSLTKTLGERQNSLDFVQKKVKELEELLDKSIPAQHDHPLPALLYHYLSRHAETVSEALYQWDNLAPGERELFLKLGTEDEIAYFKLFNEMAGTDFRDDSELKQWQEHWKAIVDEGKDESLSDKEKELGKYKVEQTANHGILDLAVKNGASSELIQSVQKVIEDRKQLLLSLEEATAKEQQKRSKEREAYMKSEEVKNVYNKIAELYTYSLVRAEERKILPLMIVKSEADPLVSSGDEVYCPFIPVAGKEIPSLLRDLTKFLLTEGNAKFISSLEGLPEGIKSWSVQYSSSTPVDTEQKVKDFLAASPELKALGLEPKVISLQLQSL